MLNAALNAFKKRKKQLSPLEEKIEKPLISEFVGISSLDPSDVSTKKSFMAYELDSYMIFEFSTRLKHISSSIEMTVFIDCDNIEEVRDHLYENYQKECENFFYPN